MLALVVFIFAVCWLPYRAMVMYNSFAKNFNAEMWNPEWYYQINDKNGWIGISDQGLDI